MTDTTQPGADALDLDKLEALARAATPGDWTYFPKPKYNEHHVSVPIEGSGMKLALFDDGCHTERPEADARYIAAANPAAVLELIAEIERLKASNIDQGKRIQWLGEYNTQRHVELSSENVQVVRQRLDAEKERDQLKAENEALRETAERMEKATAFVQQLSNAAGKQPSVATGYLHDILAMMSKEASHD